ncbi:hypothetical protein NQ317_001305 [Molorchus minor]|uniref:CRAL-TRIO domain-containing protein n=1 Tax=Molorchus minor TaxID=1323400 RepID=A0ABQ9JPF8_9CUCU|nr:hypothetical protein NQ317_001305 [Molorchus minor]
MPFKEVDVSEVYRNDPSLKSEDVKSLKEWAEKQPHLPKMSELQTAIFLSSCYYSNELAKITIDNFFTVKTLCPDIFGDRCPQNPAVQTSMNTLLVSILPKLTPEGYSVIFFKMMDPNPDAYSFPLGIRCFDMAAMLHLHKNGPTKGMIILMDMEGVVFGHLLKLSIVVMKKFMYYLQEAMPIRLQSMEFFNIVPFMDKILALMKPFMKKELLNSLYLHQDLAALCKRIPKDILPQDYGGSCEALEILREKYKGLMHDNADFFKQEEVQVVDESRRPGKPKNVGDVFGMEGTFKKLEVD